MRDDVDVLLALADALGQTVGEFPCSVRELSRKPLGYDVFFARLGIILAAERTSRIFGHGEEKGKTPKGLSIELRTRNYRSLGT